MKLFSKKSKETKEERTLRREKAKRVVEFSSRPFLNEIRPRERYVFHSDYFEIDDQFATIMSFFHKDGATDNFAVFWGINRIPGGLAEDITTITFEQIAKMTEGWIQDHQTKAEGVATINENEQNRAGSSTSKHAASRKSYDLDVIAQELQDGGAYLNLQYRLMVKAPTLKKLDAAVNSIARMYVDRFGTLETAAYAGNQRDELRTLFGLNKSKVGKGFYFTSQEYAGSYSLVTHGLEDAKGEYVGWMVGDVNNSAVLFDVDGYEHHVVVANENYHAKLDRVHLSDMWGSKISQSALLNNHRVVHILLDDCDMNKVGPKFETLTYKLDMNHGDVNMFEMFGDSKDELTIFAAQMKKIVLMAEQACQPNESDRSIIRGSLEKALTDFYVDKKMWKHNAQENREGLRVVGIPHEQVPRLREFASYLEMELKAQRVSSAKDPNLIRAWTILESTFRSMLNHNGDLFDTITSDVIDGAKTGSRVIYDFGGLMLRGREIAMAQLVNIIGFAVGNLGYGDVLLIHGAELIDNGIKEYLTTQLERLFAKGGRVVYIYNSMDKMLDDKAFCEFDKAGYTVFGNMTPTAVEDYQAKLGQEIPPGLGSLITSKSESVCYIRRDIDNVVFKQDLSLGISVNSKRKPSIGIRRR